MPIGGSEKSADLPDFVRSKFDFLTNEERDHLEGAIAMENLELNMSNGICCVARYSIPAPGGILPFEGDIEDDGHCITLRTPYDDRDGRFKDLENCVTESY